MNRKILLLLFAILIASICSVCCLIPIATSIYNRFTNDYKVAVYGEKVGDSEYYFVKQVDEYSSESLNIAGSKGDILLDRGFYNVSDKDVVKYKIFKFPTRDILVMTSYMSGGNLSGTWVSLFQIDKNGLKEIVYEENDFGACSCDYPEIYEFKMILTKTADQCEAFFGIPFDWYDVKYDI